MMVLLNMRSLRTLAMSSLNEFDTVSSYHDPAMANLTRAQYRRLTVSAVHQSAICLEIILGDHSVVQLFGCFSVIRLFGHHLVHIEVHGSLRHKRPMTQNISELQAQFSDEKHSPIICASRSKLIGPLSEKREESL